MSAKVRKIREMARAQKWFREFDGAPQVQRQLMLAALKAEQSQEFLRRVKLGPYPDLGPPVSDEATAEVREWLVRTAPTEPTDLDAL